MRPSSRFKLTTLFSLLLLFAVSFALLDFGRSSVHAAGASISLSVSYGPPTSFILASGKGFKSHEIVTLLFATTQVGTTTANTKGSISSTITVPASALPGNHFVQARGKSSGLFAQATFLVQTDWVQFGFNREHTHYNVFENVLNSVNVSGLVLDWSTSTGNSIYASSPTVVNGVAYIGSLDNKLYAFDAMTGTQKWSYTTGASVMSSPAVVDSIVYIGSEDGNVSALNAQTGRLLWRYTTGATVVSSPTVANGIVYIGSESNILYALNATTGKLLWSYAVGPIVLSAVAVDNGVIYVGAGAKVYAFNALKGILLWSSVTFNSGFAEIYSSLAVVNGVVYAGWGSVNFGIGDVFALDANTGRLLWSYATVGVIYSSPAVVNGVVYIGSSDDKLYALNAMTGALLWSYTTGGVVYSSPTIANGVIYVGSFDDKLYALNVQTGELLWSYSTGDAVASSPTVTNGVVYVGSLDDSVYAFHLPGTIP